MARSETIDMTREVIVEGVKPNRTPLVGIVLVNYNSFSDIVRVVESVQASTYEHFQIIIVDNKSPDGSGERLRTHFINSSVEVLLNPENAGFAAGNNVGICYAKSLGSSFVWLLNADTTIDKNALLALVEAQASYPSAGAFGSKIMSGESNIIWSAGGELSLEARSVSMRGYGEEDTRQYDTVERCGYLPGCSIFASVSVFESLGYLPERYFMYFEETDWCLSISKAGKALLYIPSSKIFHHSNDEKMQKPFTVYYYNRNNRLFWFQYATGGRKAKIWLKALVRELPQAAKAFLFAPTKEDRAIFKAHFLSCVDFLFGKSGKKRSFSFR